MIFAVTSLRMYENGETYYGCDALFETNEEATAYIEKDMRETLAELSEYATQNEFTIIDCNDSFHWQIEPMAVQHSEHAIVWRPEDIIAAAAEQGVELTEEQAQQWMHTDFRWFKESLTQTGNEMLSNVNWEEEFA